jgi:hypothetical protein
VLARSGRLSALRAGVAQATNPATRIANRDKRGSAADDLVMFFFMATLLDGLNAGGSKRI